MPSVNTGLDSPVFAGRLRASATYQQRPVTVVQSRVISDVSVTPQKEGVIRIVAQTKPAMPRQMPSVVLNRQAIAKPTVQKQAPNISNHTSKFLTTVAVIVFLVGLVVAGLGVRTGPHVEAQVKSVQKQ